LAPVDSTAGQSAAEGVDIAADGAGEWEKFTRFPYLKQKPYWGNHFWAKGYCVDTVGVDADMIRKYVKYQEKQEQRQVQMDLTK